MGLHLPLGVVLSLEIIEPIGTRDQEVLTDKLGVDAKETVQHTVVDERTGEKVATERQTKILDLAHRQW